MFRPGLFLLMVLLTATGLVPTQTVWAAEQTVRLRVERMTCFTCPFTVKTALRRVDGVTRVKVSLFKQRAVVTFDDSRTNIAALVIATTHAGYPSRRIE